MTHKTTIIVAASDLLPFLQRWVNVSWVVSKQCICKVGKHEGQATGFHPSIRFARRGARGRELPQNGLKVCALSNGEHIKVMVHPTSGSQDSKLERSLGR